MDSNSTAIISNYQLDWSARFRMAARRSAAGLVDFVLTSIMSLCMLALPLGASLAFNIWQPSQATTATTLDQLIEHGVQLALVLALLNQFYFYTALWESGRAQAGLGKILFGLKTTDTAGRAQSFGGVIWRISLRYALLAIIFLSADISVNLAMEFIASLQIEQLRTFMKIAIVAISFALCLVTEREQNLYDMVTRRLVVADDTKNINERISNFNREFRSAAGALNPLIIGTSLRRWRTSTYDNASVARLLLTVWSYICLTACAVLLILGGLLLLSLNEVEKGMASKNRQEASAHFIKARQLAPGIAVLYQYNYMLNDNLNLKKQEESCARLFAVRGSAQDYLARARVFSKEQKYIEAESDYLTALSQRHGSLTEHEKSAADTELTMMKLEEEAAAMPKIPTLPLHQMVPESVP